MEKYYEQEFEVSSRKNLKFKFKKIPSLEILALSDEFTQYYTNHNTEIYIDYMDKIFRSTLVCINEKWYNLKEGNNLYMPSDMEDDVYTLREIVNQFFKIALTPVFQNSNESMTEQE